MRLGIAGLGHVETPGQFESGDIGAGDLGKAGKPPSLLAPINLPIGFLRECRHRQRSQADSQKEFCLVFQHLKAKRRKCRTCGRPVMRNTPRMPKLLLPTSFYSNALAAALSWMSACLG